MRPLGQQLRSPATRYRPYRGEQQRPSILTLPPKSVLPAAAETSLNDRDDRRRRLEAVLLVAREPVPLRRLAQLANLEDGTEARTLMKDLAARYDARGSAFSIECVAGGYQLLSRSKLAPWVEKFVAPADHFRLTGPALETLAVVAYRQPAARAEVEAVRGVGCGELLRQLMDRELLRIVGRSEELGRPLLYGTTKRFLQVFGLRNLDELPNAAELLKANATPRASSPSEPQAA